MKLQWDTAQKPRKTGNFDLLSPCAASRPHAAKIPCLATSRLDTFLTFRCSFYVRSYSFVNELVGRPYAGIMPRFNFLVAGPPAVVLPSARETNLLTQRKQNRYVGLVDRVLSGL